MARQDHDAGDSCPISPPLPNRHRIEHWNGAEADHWAHHHELYDAMYGPFSQHLLPAAAISPGDVVLDIGCGSGTTTFEAARTAGSHGKALGIDVSTLLIDHARRRLATADLEDAAELQFVAADAQTHLFPPDQTDVAISRFGTMFFDDPVAAFSNIACALRPGGRLAFLTWQDASLNEWMTVPAAAALTHVPPPDDEVVAATDPFGTADPARIRGVLDRAGLTDTRLHDLRMPLTFGGVRDLDGATEFFRTGSFGQVLLAGAEPDAAVRAVAAVREALAAHLTPTGVHLQAAAWLVTAHRPT